MQDPLFPEAPIPPPDSPARLRGRARGVEPAPSSAAQLALRSRLPASLRLGTSSWSYPGWIGTVWAQEYSESKLSKQGLRAYAEHPLLRTVSLDRAFYRPLRVDQYAAYAAQVPADFRFVVKAPSLVADALIRGESGHGLQPNAQFLDPDLAVREFALPALEGLRDRLGVLLFQLSPIPPLLLQDTPALLRRLGAMLQALPSLQEQAPQAIVAVELRNAELVRPELAALLRSCGATYALGLHAKMPPIDAQLPLLRALWPGPLVCRWNLHRRHGAYGYEEAKRLYGAFDRLVDPDPETRNTLARVIAGTTGAGYPAYITLGNKAEGSAPLSVAALAEAIASAGAVVPAKA
jgi:uncharacterized protein YecE (DUF72 family)